MAQRADLIGKEVRITESSNKTLEGLEGKVCDETKNSLVIEDKQGKMKKVLKNICVFEIDGEQINGKNICVRAHEHVKTRWKRK
ncbi:MAG: ribonuclease P component 1 family protein [Nanobdellota archaeon]